MKKSKPNDFAYMLSRFLSIHLAGERNLSPNTILSYRDTFKLLLGYLRDEKKLQPEKVTLESIDRRTIIDFIEWLKVARSSSASTCNQGLGAIHAFFEFVQYEMPERVYDCQDIIGTKTTKAPQSTINYLTTDGIKAILAMPDTTTKNGRRDAMILSLLYDTGARVQELVDICVGDVRLTAPATIRLVGKGNKARIVPLLHGTESLLREYIKDLPKQPFMDNNRPLFLNREKQKFSRWGIAYTLKNTLMLPEPPTPN